MSFSIARPVLISLVISISACAQSGVSSQSTEKDPESRVYFYRYKQFIGYQVKPSVYCDEIQLARMDNGRFFVARLVPGKHTFRSNDKQSGIEMDVKGGQTYYIRVEIIDGFLKQYGRLVLMAGEQGAYEVKKLKPSGPENIKDRSTVLVEEKKPK